MYYILIINPNIALIKLSDYLSIKNTHLLSNNSIKIISEDEKIF